MPIVQKFVEDFLGKKIERGVDPMECVAMGARLFKEPSSKEKYKEVLLLRRILLYRWGLRPWEALIQFLLNAIQPFPHESRRSLPRPRKVKHLLPSFVLQERGDRWPDRAERYARQI